MAATRTLYKLRIYTVWIYNYDLIPNGTFVTQGICFLRQLMISFSKIICNVQRTNNSEVTNVRDYFALKTPHCCA